MGAPASLRKPAVVLGSIKEKSALARVPGHSTGDMLLAGVVGAAYVAVCFRARRGGVHTVMCRSDWAMGSPGVCLVIGRVWMR